MLAKTNHLIMAGLWVFLNASVFRSRLCQMLVWKCVCKNTYGTTQHCYLSSTCLLRVLFSSHVILLSFLDVSSAGQGPDHPWHLGSSLFHFNRFLLLHVFWKSEKNALLPFCPDTARSVQSSLVAIKFFFFSKEGAIFHWYCDSVKMWFMLLMLNQFIKGRNNHGRWDYAFIQLNTQPPVG